MIKTELEFIHFLTMKRLTKKILLPVFEFYFRVRMWKPVWFGVVNRKERNLWKTQKIVLNNTEQRIRADLLTKGIAIAHWRELFGDTSFQELKTYAESLRKEKAGQRNGETSAKLSKPFLENLFLPSPMINFENPFHRFALAPSVISVVNAYLGVCAKLYYVTLNITIPVGENGAAVASQRWHRDPEDRRMCKVFLYLNDVDENAGPFIYVTKSCYGLKYGSLFPQKPPIGIYPDAAELEKNIAKEDIKVCTGRAGTIIFCDTSGLHKGGFAKTGERIMFTAGYRTNGAVTPNRVRYPDHYPEKLGEMNFPPASEYAATPFTVSKLNRKLFSYTQRWKEELNGENMYHEG